jgi:hypothetical protein
MSAYLQNCPAGHHVDYDECPYPADRSGKRYQINCIDGDCPWELIGPTREEVIKAWNYLPEKAE